MRELRTGALPETVFEPTTRPVNGAGRGDLTRPIKAKHVGLATRQRQLRVTRKLSKARYLGLPVSYGGSEGQRVGIEGGRNPLQKTGYGATEDIR